MNTAQSRLVGAALFFLFIFLSGFWLSHSGKPYSGIIFNVHKLLGVAAVIFLGITMYQASQTAQLSAVELSAGLVAGLFFISTIVSGGLVSIDKTMPTAISIMHKLFPYLTVLSTAATLYLLLGRKQ